MKVVSFTSFTIRISLLVITIASLLQSCGGSTIYFEQTCIECVTSQCMASQSMCSATSNAPRIMKGGAEVPDDTMIPETGEILDLRFMRRKEAMISEDSNDFLSVYGKRIAIAKLKGKYYLTGEGFSNLWILTPAEQDRASLEQIPLPDGGVKGPVFKINISKGRFNPLLILSAANYSSDYYLDSNNEWGKIF